MALTASPETQALLLDLQRFDTALQQLAHRARTLPERAAVTALNQTRYGLSSSVYTRDVNAAFRAIRDFETGIVYVNAGTIGAETHLPFGGTKETGNGHREAGHAALDTYTEWKSIYVDFSGRLQRAQIDNQPG